MGNRVAITTRGQKRRDYQRDYYNRRKFGGSFSIKHNETEGKQLLLFPLKDTVEKQVQPLQMVETIQPSTNVNEKEEVSTVLVEKESQEMAINQNILESVQPKKDLDFPSEKDRTFSPEKVEQTAQKTTAHESCQISFAFNEGVCKSGSSNEIPMVERVEKINHPQNFQPIQKNSTVDVSKIDLVSELIESAKVQAYERLFPSERTGKKVWAVVERVANFLMALACLFVLAKTVSEINQNLLMPVMICEAVAVFFSFSLSKTKGGAYFFGVVLIALSTVFSNFLIVKSIKHQEFLANSRGKEALEIRQVLKDELRREREIISDLQARSRFTMAKEHSQRVDLILEKLKDSPNETMVSSELVLIQIFIRLLVSLALVFCVHRISLSIKFT